MRWNFARILALLLILAASPAMAEGPVQVDSTGALMPRVGPKSVNGM